EPWRARPVPFWRYGFLPPPRTSPRFFVLCVPWRAAASWATTTWWISGMLTLASKISAGSSTVPTVSPAGERTLMVLIASGPLGRGADQDEAAVRTGDGALDEQQALVRVNGVDGQVLGGHALVAHAAGHAQALEHAARGGAATDGAGRAVLALGAVRGAEAAEAVALHDTGGALALAGAGHVDLGARLEHLGGDLLAE